MYLQETNPRILLASRGQQRRRAAYEQPQKKRRWFLFVLRDVKVKFVSSAGAVLAERHQKVAGM